MRLSDAIRLGAMLKPQAFDSSRHVGSCVLRAAADAVGIPDSHGVLNYAAIWRHFPQLQQAGPGLVCPACGARECDLLTLLYHLNDHHRWTRERIADYVAALEPAETPDRQTTTSAEGVLRHAHV